MNEQTIDGLIEDFLKRVEEKLPQWLKDKPDELKEITEELKEHILDNAEQISGTDSLTMESVQQAITKMGSPSRIAREYKMRGTPKIFITEELFPIYVVAMEAALLAIISIIAIMTLVGVISAIVSAIMFNAAWTFVGAAIGQGIGGVFLGAASIFTVVTVIFVALSMEGYLPEDFELDATRLNEWPFVQGIFPKGDYTFSGDIRPVRHPSVQTAEIPKESTPVLPPTTSQPHRAHAHARDRTLHRQWGRSIVAGGAEGGSRTPMSKSPLSPEPSASTSSATSASAPRILCYRLGRVKSGAFPYCCSLPQPVDSPTHRPRHLPRQVAHATMPLGVTTCSN